MKTKLTDTDKDKLLSYIESDDMAGIVELLSDYGLLILDVDRGASEEAAAEWLQGKGWGCVEPY